MATVYWFGGSGNWSDHANHWSNNSGNAPASLHGAAPGADDNVVFDTLSNATAYTVTVDASATCLDFTMGAPLAGKVTWAGSSALAISGSLNLSGGTAGITRSYTGIITFNGSGSKTITNNGITYASLFLINNINLVLTLQDNLVSTGDFNPINGTFDANDFNVTFGKVANGGIGTKVFYLGNGTWTLTSTGNVWVPASSAPSWTVYAEGSTIKITDTSNTAITFIGRNLIYNNLWFARGASTASNTISGSNTFNQFKDTGTEAHSILFTAGTTQRVNTWDVSGSASKLITLNSTTTAAFTLVLREGVWRNVSSDYLNIQHCIATTTTAFQWYAGKNSVNNQATETAGRGWIFANAPRRGITKEQNYYATLKRWNGKEWVSANLKYQGQPVNLKVYDNGWQDVKINIWT